MVQKIRLPEQNNVTLVGRLTNDPDLRYTQKGQAVCRISLAVNRRFKNATGEWMDDTSFIPVTVWRDAATRCNERLKKGYAVHVFGRLRSRSWEDKSGQKRTTLEVTAQRIQFLTLPEAGGVAVADASKGEGTAKQQPAVAGVEGAHKGEETPPIETTGSEGEIKDEEVPF